MCLIFAPSLREILAACRPARGQSARGCAHSWRDGATAGWDPLDLAAILQTNRLMGSLTDDLLSPQAYPEPRPAGVELRETHASWVFVTQRDVWKVKKPVKFGFLDFSTLDKRHHFCLEEVRINARLAPGVYRGVVPIVRGEEHLAIAPEGGGDAVEYAVHMRRLADGEAALSMLKEGHLSAEHLRRLALRLAEFYASLPPLRDLAACAAFAHAVQENFEQLEPFVGRFLQRPVLDRMQKAQSEAMARLMPTLRAREAAGSVREGHGDLRLEHVYFPGGSARATPLCIDALEFSAAFRMADVGLDLAFMVMELRAQVREDLAEDFLAAFAHASNDFEIYALMEPFVAYRALVRAKVACIVAADTTTSAAKRDRKTQEADRLFALADATLGPEAPSPKAAPFIIVVGGLPGVGKSTLAGALALALHVPVVASDATRKHLAGLAPTARGGPDIYSPAFSRKTMDEVLRRAALVLGAGRGVILDATFRHAEDRARALALADKNGCALLFAQAHCDEALVHARLRARQRGASVSDADAAVFEKLKAVYQNPDELPGPLKLRVDTALPLAAQLNLVKARLPDHGRLQPHRI